MLSRLVRRLSKCFEEVMLALLPNDGAGFMIERYKEISRQEKGVEHGCTSGVRTLN
jgi:hypothetical protein